MSVDPKFHPKIIGRKGAVISQIRKEHDVSIQFPDKGDEEQVSDQEAARLGVLTRRQWRQWRQPLPLDTTS